MNGRIYDPKLGRFLQADPIVQAPKNSQGLNRYSYVLNNPLSYTDPSGYFFKELVNFAFAVVGVIVTPQNPYAWLRLAVSAGMLFGSTRQQNSIIPRGVVAAAFTNGFSTATSLSTSGVQHGAVQDMGGPSDGVRATTIGGTGSDQTGWKFANGAAMAGFAYAVAAGTHTATKHRKLQSNEKLVSFADPVTAKTEREYAHEAKKIVDSLLVKNPNLRPLESYLTEWVSSFEYDPSRIRDGNGNYSAGYNHMNWDRGPPSGKIIIYSPGAVDLREAIISYGHEIGHFNATWTNNESLLDIYGKYLYQVWKGPDYTGLEYRMPRR